jgi:hypothetical protein
MKDKNIKEMAFFETKDVLALKQWFSMVLQAWPEGPQDYFRFPTIGYKKKMYWIFLIFYKISSGIMV